jgi:hypothetical protein
MRLTVTPGRAAPEGSNTIPVIAPVDADWPARKLARARIATITEVWK